MMLSRRSHRVPRFVVRGRLLTAGGDLKYTTDARLPRYCANLKLSSSRHEINSGIGFGLHSEGGEP